MMIFIAVVLEPKLVQADEMWGKFKEAAMGKVPRGKFITDIVEKRTKGEIQVWLQ